MNLYELTKGVVKDTAGKLDDPRDYESAINGALMRYSKHRPRLIPEDIPGQDGPDVALPTGWVAGLSAISGIEYPIGTVPETLIDRRDWRFYRTPTDTFIRFSNVRPAAVDSVRVLYNTLHTEATASPADLEAIANLAASFCCRQLAALYAQTSDPTIQADSVNYRTKSGEYTSLANKLEGQYKEALGIKDGDVTPAAMATAAPPASKRPRLTRGRV